MMVAPDSSRQFQTRRTNSSRPSSSRVRLTRSSIRSTTFCVAMPAWSVPQIQSALRPCMRRRRTITSCIEPLSAWPMCSDPVTLGGGTAMTKGSPGSSGSTAKAFAACQRANIAGSTAAGS